MYPIHITCWKVFLFWNIHIIFQVHVLSLQGGHNTKDTARRVTEKMMHNSVQVQCNWAGKTGWKGQPGVIKYGLGPSKNGDILIIEKH